MHMIRALFRLSAIAVVICGGGVRLCAEPAEKGPHKDLVQYIRDATRLGLKEPQIEHNAVKAGWPAEAVREAMAYLQQNPTAPPGAASSEPAAASTTSTAPAQTAAAAETSRLQSAPDEYRIGAGDVLQISVWKEPEASVNSTVVRPDGKIGMPLLKEIEVVGMTPAEAEKVITEKLSKLIPAADVTVVVSGINSKKIYMVGAVKKEGPISYTYRMTVMQALSEAGGLNDYAKRKKIYILRTQNGKDYKLPFDYEAVLRGERMELNVPLLPGDTVVVPH